MKSNGVSIEGNIIQLEFTMKLPLDSRSVTEMQAQFEEKSSYDISLSMALIQAGNQTKIIGDNIGQSHALDMLTPKKTMS